MTSRRNNQIPKGWHPKSLSEVSHILLSNVDKKSLAGETPVRLCNYLDVYNNTYITRNLDFMDATASFDEISRLSVELGDVIITKDSETPEDIGVPAVCIENIPDLVCGYHLALIKPNCEEVDPVFLSSQIAHERISRYFTINANGSTRFGLTTSAIFNTPLWLPPFPEQRRIAEILDTANAAIRETERVIAKLRQVKQGLLHDLLTRGLDAHGHLRDPDVHPEQFKDSPLGRIPIEWEVTTLDEIAVHVGSGATPTGGSKVYQSEGIVFIRSQNVDFDGLLLEDVAHISEEIHQDMARSEIFAHDVLINITGASIGRCCPVPEWLGRANVNQHVCAIRQSNPTHANAAFLSLVLASYIGQHQVEILNAGSNREGLNYTELRAFKIPWPSASERKCIAAVLDAHDTRIRAEAAVLAKRRQVKRGLMDDLLTGRVRI